MVLIRDQNDPLERCGQGIGCGTYIDEVGYCKKCQQKLLEAIDQALIDRVGIGLLHIARKINGTEKDDDSGRLIPPVR
jgi:hypothetical protein